MNLNKENEVHKPRITRLGAIVSEYIGTGEDYQSIKVLGHVLLNEYMVPFEFASILLV
jgi:NADH-quinone oxidoreductase subunit J